MIKKAFLFSLYMITVYACDESPKHTMFWLDLEMTGLNPQKDLILQSAGIITDNDLNIVAESPERVMRYDELPEMSKYVHQMHTTSGLLQQVKTSHYTVPEVEQELIAAFKANCKPGWTQLCGNSIWKDREFLALHMPTFLALFHHQMIDVSSIGGMAWRWFPEECKGFKKQKKHTSREDILESIAELRYFRNQVFKQPESK